MVIRAGKDIRLDWAVLTNGSSWGPATTMTTFLISVKDLSLDLSKLVGVTNNTSYVAKLVLIDSSNPTKYVGISENIASGSQLSSDVIASLKSQHPNADTFAIQLKGTGDIATNIDKTECAKLELTYV